MLPTHTAPAHEAEEHSPRLIAFYLPQYHPIPENDAWWGKGFTEWTNVSRARPLFTGHYQPRLPADLGFYDLRLPEVRKAQAELARAYGIYGFCYYYYWFKDGRQLLERPVQEMLARGEPDFPFCLCWANENWTRRWDGQEHEVLMPQDHSLDNCRSFIRSVIPYFKDPRYIRVNGRPLLLVYRATLLEDPAATIAMWHEEVGNQGLPNPYLIAAESLEVVDSTFVSMGFDAVCEFPPHKAISSSVIKEMPAGIDQGFTGTLLDYEKMAEGFINRPALEYPRHRCVTLAWDNTARRGNTAHLALNFSLHAYHHWLGEMVAYTRRSFQGDQQILFVNAWNEWGEGVYLEPDQLHGHGYLQATRAALFDQPLFLRADQPRSIAMPSADERPRETTGSVADGQIVALPTLNRGSLKLVSISMIGNEADIVEAFVRDNLRYVDHMLIAEHNALDGTREILAALVEEGLPLTVTEVDTSAYIQGAVTNALLKDALERFAPDWVIPLDADEFLDVDDRHALEAALTAIGASHGRLAWIQQVPTTLDDPSELHPARRIRHRYAYPPPEPEVNPYSWKIVLNCRLIAPYLDRYDLEKGSHRVVFKATHEPSAQPIDTLEKVLLRHYPVRSLDQLGLKAGLGLLQRHLAEKHEWGGPHIPSMHKQLLEGRHALSNLQSAVREYLDTGRYSPETLADTAIIVDPKSDTREIRYQGLRQPATVTMLRWINQRHGPPVDIPPSSAT